MVFTNSKKRSRFTHGAACAGLMGASMGAAVSASAQNVMLYGIFDTGVERVTNVGANRDSVVRMPSITGTLASRFGLRGSEDLGGGLKAIFLMESGFAPDTGASNQGGRLFGRQAYVGLQGNWGTISFGRQYSYMYIVGIGDTLGGNIYTAGLLDPYLANARLDNSIVYKGTFDGLTVGASYSLGRDTVASAAGGGCAGESAADSKACRDVSAMVQYIAGDWGLALAGERMWGGGGNGSPLPLSSQTDTRAYISGFYKVGRANFGGGFVRRNNEGSSTPKSNFWHVGVSYVIDAIQLDAQYGRLDIKDSANDAQVLAARATHHFSKRTSAYVTAGRMKNQGLSAISIDGGNATGSNPAPGVSQTGVMVGLRHIF
jgi:predicted porin